MKIIESTIETRQIFISEAYKYAMADGEEESPFVFTARMHAGFDKYVRGSLVYKDDDRAYADFKNKETKEIQKGICFGSFYLCKNFLPKDLIFEELQIGD